MEEINTSRPMVDNDNRMEGGEKEKENDSE